MRKAAKKNATAPVVEIYASGPGLMMHSPDAVSGFVAGQAYWGARRHRRAGSWETGGS